MNRSEMTKLRWQNPEYRKHMSDVHKGQKQVWTGKKLSPERVIQCSLARKGKPSWNKGIPMSDSTRQKLKESLRKIGHTFHKMTPEQEQKRLENLRIGKKAIIGKYAGDKCCHWQGGIATLPYGPEFVQTLKDKIRARDRYQCQNKECNMTEEEHLIVIGSVLAIHHIDYDKLNCKEDNLVSLCNQCNTRANFNRSHWSKYYSETVCLQLK
jgi:hypothetical protein